MVNLVAKALTVSPMYPVVGEQDVIELVVANLWSVGWRATVDRPIDAEECDFEAFSRDLLRALVRHAEQLSTEGSLLDEQCSSDDTPDPFDSGDEEA